SAAVLEEAWMRVAAYDPPPLFANPYQKREFRGERLRTEEARMATCSEKGTSAHRFAQGLQARLSDRQGQTLKPGAIPGTCAKSAAMIENKKASSSLFCKKCKRPGRERAGQRAG